MDGEQVAHTPVCSLFWPAGFVKAQPVESVGLSPPDLLKYFVVNFESLVQNEAQMTTGRARPAVNPSPLKGVKPAQNGCRFFPCKGQRGSTIVSSQSKKPSGM